VLTINPTKMSRRKETAEQKKNKTSCAFRVCIPSADSAKLCDVSLLPEGIVVRKWFFVSSTKDASAAPGSPSGAHQAGSGRSPSRASYQPQASSGAPPRHPPSPSALQGSNQRNIRRSYRGGRGGYTPNGSAHQAWGDIMSPHFISGDNST